MRTPGLGASWKGTEGRLQECYLIEVQGGVIAEGTDGGQLHQPIILPCANWLIVLQAGNGAREEGRERDKSRRIGSEMQRQPGESSEAGREMATTVETRWETEQGQGRKKRENGGQR